MAAARGLVAELIKNHAVRVNKAYLKNMPLPVNDGESDSGRRFGGSSRHWLISTYDLKATKVYEDAHAEFDPQAVKMQAELEEGAEVGWLRWPVASPRGSRILKGDWITKSWHGPGEISVVYPPCLVVLNRTFGKHRAIFYQTEPNTEDGRVSWPEFHKMALKAGMDSKINDKSEVAIVPDQAVALSAQWSARQSSGN